MHIQFIEVFPSLLISISSKSSLLQLQASSDLIGLEFLMASFTGKD